VIARGFTSGVVLTLLLGSAVGLAVLRDSAYGEPRPAEAALYVRSGALLERASLSNRALLSDIYWIRAIQYYGGTHLSANANKNYDLLYPMLDIVTTLDPKFTIAYRFGAVFLAEQPPGGPGRPDLAVALLQKGTRVDPGRWQYYLDLGFVYYWHEHDYKRAAAAFERGGKLPGAPLWLPPLAGMTLQSGGDRRSARQLWLQMYETADNTWLKETARLRLTQLQAMDQIDALERLVSRMQQTAGVRPRSWQALIRGGLLPGVPLDPSGTPYVIDPGTGQIGVSPSSRIYPLPAAIPMLGSVPTPRQ
jgi:tetratricopeptide (TPR) repeat protein